MFKTIKKYKTDLLVLLFISLFLAVLFPNFLKDSATIELPNIFEFVKWLLIIFVVLGVPYLVYKPSEREARIPDGEHKLYNEKDQITKDGIFNKGDLISGTKHVYSKDGTLIRIEIFKNGVCVGEAPMNKQ